jgi:hypothetical protein
MPRRNANGEGSIFYRADKRLWVAEIVVGWDDTGKPKVLVRQDSKRGLGMAYRPLGRAAEGVAT